MAIEFARNVCGLGPVGHGETDPESTDLLIEPLQCSLVGEERTVEVMAGTTVAAAMGAGPSTERFFCSYGLAARHVPTLEAHGLVVSARDEAGEVRAVELPGHPWFVGSLWQPELSSDPTWVHPLITGFANAVRSHAQRTAPATVGSIGG
jgi:CTP synthase (UTP-ammonia lyase)